MISQNFQGKIYDEESTVSGVKVINITQNILTYTDEQGDFKIEAAVNDSIVFRSYFYVEKQIVLTKNDFDNIKVIELKKSLNALEEVLIKKENDSLPFEPEETNSILKNQIQEDIKNNPHLYGKNPGGMDFMAIGRLIGKLFKSKRQNVEIPTPATFADFKKLFETDSYFTMKFLKTELQIPEDYTYLFMDYCEAQFIDSKLLTEENRFMLLDVFLRYSEEFLEILKAQKKE